MGIIENGDPVGSLHRSVTKMAPEVADLLDPNHTVSGPFNSDVRVLFLNDPSADRAGSVLMIPSLRAVQYASKFDGGQLLPDAFAAGEQVRMSRAPLIRGPSQEFQYMFMSNKDAHFRADGSFGSRPLQRDDLIPS